MLFKSLSISTTAAVTFLFVLISLPQAEAATAEDWRARSIYQIITDRFARTDGSLTEPCDASKQRYCGGTFEGIMNQLDYIQGMGFTAIWISPVVENIQEVTKFGEGYHGFWTRDINKINEHFGTEDTLKALSAELHRRGMYLMIDVVINNIANAGDGARADYAKFATPFNDKKYFHPFKLIKDYSDQLDVQNGWLGDTTVSLPDLDTESQYVQDVWHEWIKEMVDKYALDGLRIDAAKHVNKPFWTPFQEAAKVFTMGEVFTQAYDDANTTCSWAMDALSTVLNFKVWHSIVGTFANSTNPMRGLGYVMNEVARGCYDSTLLGTFSENHGVARFAAATSDLSQQKNALVFDIMSDGIPVIYYGAEQQFSGRNDPLNREAFWLNPTGYDTTAPLYQLIKSVNTARNAVNLELHGIDYSNWSGYWAHKAKVLYSTEDILVLRKGYDTSVIVALTNVGEGGPDIGPVHIGETNFVQRQTIVEVISCNSTIAGQFGEFDVTLRNGEPQVWVPARYLHTVDGLCEDLLKRLNRTGTTTERLVSAAIPFSAFLQRYLFPKLEELLPTDTEVANLVAAMVPVVYWLLFFSIVVLGLSIPALDAFYRFRSIELIQEQNPVKVPIRSSIQARPTNSRKHGNCQSIYVHNRFSVMPESSDERNKFGTRTFMLGWRAYECETEQDDESGRSAYGAR